MKKNDAIYVAGHNGMVGSAIVRKLKKEGYTNIITAASSELDLRDQQSVFSFLAETKPRAVVIAAAKVGGILANDSWPYTFIHENIIIQDSLLHGAHLADVEKVIFLGSSCIYPKFADQPMSEDSLLTGALEPTNQWYAIAKIAGVKSCQALRKQFGRDYVSLMPTNLYGPNDNFDLKTSHVLPAMIRKFYDAAENGHTDVELWGTGSPRREFLHVDDVADAVHFALKRSLESHLYNVGTGKDISIKELAELIQNLTGHKGNIVWDSSKPDGTPRKLMDVTRLAREGWTYATGLKEGIKTTIDWYAEHRNDIREVHFDK
jgi:GDP-L-fucose synthase